jgi:major membrane immunogen (membrane-anchored lipoprotein)
MREICNAEWDDIQDRLKEKDAEIDRLKVEIFDQQEQRFWMQQRLSSLLTSAADALQDWVGTPGVSTDAFGRAHRDLIAELRKAAE